MRLMDALGAMADAMTAVNASRRQVRGTDGWRDQVRAVLEAAAEAAAAARLRRGTWRDLVDAALDPAAADDAYLQVSQMLRILRHPARRVRTPDPSVHRGWMGTAAAITAELNRQTAAASLAAAAARQAAGLAWAAARIAQGRAEARIAVAEGSEAKAAAAAGSVADLDQARRASTLARKLEAIAWRCDAWLAAAADAAAAGSALARRENEIHAPVGAAIAAAGGRAWIAADKHFHVDGGQ